jgi:hypothetical protein
MASHPTFNPNHLNEIGPQLNKDPEKPLINRAVQGMYPVGDMLMPFAYAIHGENVSGVEELQMLAEAFAFDRAPEIALAVAQPLPISESSELHVSPLQVALACAALSNHGTMPAPRIAAAVDTPEEGWVVLPALGEPRKAVSASDADEAVQSFIQAGQNYWSHVGLATGDESDVTWFIAGTPPNWQAAPLVVVVALEENNPHLAERIGRELLIDSMNP